MTLITSGSDQNSYVTNSEANALLLTMAASFLTGDDALTDVDDDRFLIEAASDLQYLWRWAGWPTDLTQTMAWPRRYVTKPGWVPPLEPGWSTPYDEQMFMMYKVNVLSNSNPATEFVDQTAVPKAIKEAQVLIAVLRKQGGNLIGDNQGDAQGTKLGSLTVSYVNAIRESADIHKRTGQYGTFIGDALLRTPNGI